MEVLLGIILAIPFSYFNYKIIQTDIIEKRIPNRFLGYLIWLLIPSYIYGWYFLDFGNIHILMYFLHVFIGIVVSFFLFHFGKWGAGDAKYFLILGLFIPQIGMISFALNIAFVTLLYLIVNFIWFWVGPNLWLSNRRRNFYQSLWKSKKDTLSTKRLYKNRRQLIIDTLKWLNIFFIVFISIRILRIHVLKYISDTYDISLHGVLQSPNYKFSIVIIILLSLGIGILIQITSKKLRSYFSELYKKYSIIIINVLGIVFLGYEYMTNPQEFFVDIKTILTISLIIFLFVKVLMSAYKIVFTLSEERYMRLDHLKPNMIIKKDFIKRLLVGKEDIIEYVGYDLDSDVLTEKSIASLKKIFRYINTCNEKYHKTDTPIHSIITVNTFAFGPYIFAGFLISLIMNGSILEFAIKYLR